MTEQEQRQKVVQATQAWAKARHDLADAKVAAAQAERAVADTEMAAELAWVEAVFDEPDQEA